ncbi:MAG: hypothetical protein FJW80_01015 [Actinobacteria bacterium]|nr:hypothetical protein [Actinomycetota bacterium]
MRPSRGVIDPTATRTIYAHGLGGSSLNWTDLMGLRMPTSPGIAITTHQDKINDLRVEGCGRIRVL